MSKGGVRGISWQAKQKLGLDQFPRDLERELDKRTDVLRAEGNAATPGTTTVDNYHGPVVPENGDNAQLAEAALDEVTVGGCPHNPSFLDHRSN